LQAGLERFERLAEGQANPRPSAGREHELEQQVREREPCDGDAKVVAAGEVEAALTTQWVVLGEDHVSTGARLGTPIADATLKGTKVLVGGEALWLALAKLAQQCGRLEHAMLVGEKEGNDNGEPNTGERVSTGAPLSRRLGLRRQRTVLPRASGALAYASLESGLKNGFALHEELSEKANLRVGDHERAIRSQGSDGPSARPESLQK
jgi:hypothetical protein